MSKHFNSSNGFYPSTAWYAYQKEKPEPKKESSTANYILLAFGLMVLIVLVIVNVGVTLFLLNRDGSAPTNITLTTVTASSPTSSTVTTSRKRTSLSTSAASNTTKSRETLSPSKPICEAYDSLPVQCHTYCRYTLVESIPQNLTYPVGSPSFPSTFSAWKTLMNRATKSIDIAAFYWSLRGSDDFADPTDMEGETVFAMLKNKSMSIPVRIAQNAPTKTFPQLDTQALANASSLVSVRGLNFTRWYGGGVLHTKLWVVDNTHFYVGSANLDWRSLTQSSPPEFCPTNREDDLSAILNIINSATKFVHIAVMDYFPVTLYQPHNSYWPYIDDALRNAAYSRGVQVCLLASKWRYTKHNMYYFLKSLEYINRTMDKLPGSISIKLFQVPATPEQSKIPFARVNHNKYMVTEDTAYIGTSNWSGDYFITTGGVGFIAGRNGTNSSVADQLESVFQRDWNSKYSSKFSSILFSSTCR